MGLTLITPPSTYPATLAEVKEQCRVDGTDEDTLLEGLIAAATDYVEQCTGRSLMEQTWKLWLDEFSSAIMLPKGPVQSITSVQYLDVEGVTQVATGYTLDNSNDPAWLVLDSDAQWPATLDAVNAVSITYVTGYSPFPASIKQAILLLIGQWYDNRADATDRPMIAMPNAVEALLTNYRSFAF